MTPVRKREVLAFKGYLLRKTWWAGAMFTRSTRIMKTLPEVDMNADASALVVRYSSEAREHFHAKVIPHMRRQAIQTIVFGSVLGLVMVATLSALLFLEDRLTLEQGIPISGLLLLPPVGFIFLGVRKLRRPFTLPDLVLAITDDQLILGRLERMGLFGYSRPELHWDRRTTQTEYRSGNGLFTHDRITFTHHEGGRRRTQNVAVSMLDTSAEEILAAMQRP